MTCNHLYVFSIIPGSTASAGQASTCSDGAVMEASRASLDMNVTPPLPTDKLSKLALQVEYLTHKKDILMI